MQTETERKAFFKKWLFNMTSQIATYFWNALPYVSLALAVYLYYFCCIERRLLMDPAVTVLFAVISLLTVYCVFKTIKLIRAAKHKRQTIANAAMESYKRNRAEASE